MHSIDLQWVIPVVDGMLFGLLAMVLHEIGHMCVAQALGLKVKHVGISWKGMYTVREAGPPEKSLQVALGGPLTNLALMALWPAAPVFGLANLFMGVCNLLPIKGSDGERVMRCMEEMHAARAHGPEHDQLAGAIPAAAVKVGSNHREASVDPAG
jgi:Zn-dependent protease